MSFQSAVSKPATFFLRRLKSVKTLLLLYFLIIIVAGTLEYAHGPKLNGGFEYTHYENYLIFRNAFNHLLEQSDLYQAYPGETWDYYKYSPSFTVIMAPFTSLPDWLGLNLWNLLNGLLLFWAIWRLPGLTRQKKIWILWFILLELLTSVQNSQSNGLMAALMILAFTALEQRQVIWSGLLIGLAIYLKLFGGVMALFILAYDKKLRFTLSLLGWVVLLWAIPLLFVPLSYLIDMYRSWFNLLRTDQAASYGLSLMGLLHSWIGLESFKELAQICGMAFFVVPFLRRKEELPEKRLLMLSAALIWVVIFNHKAESPTYIIAMCGIAIWYVRQQPTGWNRALVILAFILISLSPTDIFPGILRSRVVVPFTLKALPAVIIWIVLQEKLVRDWFVQRMNPERR